MGHGKVQGPGWDWWGWWGPSAGTVGARDGLESFPASGAHQGGAYLGKHLVPGTQNPEAGESKSPNSATGLGIALTQGWKWKWKQDMLDLETWVHRK